MLARLFLIILVLVVAAGCASGRVYVDLDEVSGIGAEVSFPEGKIVPIKVKRVISGNEIELSNNEIVSYIGVHIPRLYNIPEEAKELNKSLVTEDGIRLEFDNKQRDPKNRLLAYVYTTDGIFVNAEIIRKGLAEALTQPPNALYDGILKGAEEEAKTASRGIWSEQFKKE